MTETKRDRDTVMQSTRTILYVHETDMSWIALMSYRLALTARMCPAVTAAGSPPVQLWSEKPGAQQAQLAASVLIVP